MLVLLELAKMYFTIQVKIEFILDILELFQTQLLGEGVVLMLLMILIRQHEFLHEIYLNILKI